MASIWGSRQSENETKLIVGSGDEAIYDKIFLSKYDKVGSLHDNDSFGELIVVSFSRKLFDSHKTSSWI